MTSDLTLLTTEDLEDIRQALQAWMLGQPPVDQIRTADLLARVVEELSWR